MELDSAIGKISNEEIVALRRHALYLESEATIASDLRGQQLQDTLYVSATIFEFLAQYVRFADRDRGVKEGLSKRLASGDLADLVRSTFLYALGRHESNSAVIGRRLIRQVADELQSELTLTDRSTLISLRIMVSLVSRQLRTAIDLGADLGSVVTVMRKEWQGESFPVEDGRFLASWLRIGEASASLAFGLLNGAEEVIGKAIE